MPFFGVANPPLAAGANTRGFAVSGGLVVNNSVIIKPSGEGVFLEVANADIYLEVANAASVIANNTTNFLQVANADVYLQVANATSLYTTKAYAASNTYVNATFATKAYASSNTYVNATFATKAYAAANTYVQRYLQVANAAALIANNTTKYLEVANASSGDTSAVFANVNPRIISVVSTAATANTKAVQALADAAAANTRAESARTLAVSANSNLNAYKANTNPRFNLYMAVANLATVATSGAYGDLSGTPPATSIAMYKYFPSTNTSTFTGNDADSNSLNYTNTNVEVYLNGLKLIKNNDFRAPNTTHLTLYANAVSGDSVQIVSYQANVGSVSGLNNLSDVGDVANTGFSNAEILIYDGTNFKSSANNDQGVRIGGIGISSYGSGFFFLKQPSGTTWNRAGTGAYNVIMNPGQATPPSGQGIVAIGYEAGNSIGNGSVAIGKYAGYLQTGLQGVFIGEFAGGFLSGSGSGNVGVGRSALTRVGGSSNVGIGRGGGKQITSGSDNTVVGTYAIAQGAGCTGSKNVAIGKYSLAYHTSGTHTVSVGYEAGYYSYGMSKSVLLGSFAGGSASGNNNICIGYKSGKTGGSLSNGQKNTIIGSDTGGITTGNNNVVLGASATASATGVTNEITLGDSNISTIRAQVTSITALSDERDKTNIIDIPVGLDFVEEMRPVKFDWNRRDGSKQGEGQVGFIAQDLQSLEKDYGVEQYTQLVYNSNPERLEATPLNAFPIIVKAIQELSKKIDDLQAQINDMQGQSDE